MQLLEGTSADYKVTLTTDPVGTVIINVTSGDPAATVSPSQLTFIGGDNGNWKDGIDVTVTAVDNEDTGNGSATISHAIGSHAGNGYGDSPDLGAVEVTIADDETAQLVFTPPALSIMQDRTGTAEGVYEVSLSTAPATGETVSVTVSPGPGISGDIVLTFDEDNWANEDGVPVGQEVTITLLSTTGAGAITVNHALATEGGATPNYTAAANAGTVTVTVTVPESG